MTTEFGFSKIECKIIRDQIERRARYRQEFLRLRTDPCKHAMEAGYVFDDKLQRFLSLKACQYDYFQANKRTITQALITVLPMFIFGYFVWNQRSSFEKACRCGILKYRDRRFKLA